MEQSTATDGTVEVRLLQVSTLDRESRDTYELQIIAIDGGDPARSGSMDVNIVVSDANDNTPTFSKPVYEVRRKICGIKSKTIECQLIF